MDISRIVLNLKTQRRASTSEERIQRYAELMSDGITFPAIVVFGTEEEAILSDGWHRLGALKSLGRREINVDLRPGGLKEAILHALNANAGHGAEFTTSERVQNAKDYLLIDASVSDGVIGKHCGVSLVTVRKYRAELEAAFQIEKVEHRTGLDGKEYPADRPRKASSPKPPTPPADNYDDGDDAVSQPRGAPPQEDVDWGPPVNPPVFWNGGEEASPQGIHQEREIPRQPTLGDLLTPEDLATLPAGKPSRELQCHWALVENIRMLRVLGNENVVDAVSFESAKTYLEDCDSLIENLVAYTEALKARHLGSGTIRRVK